MINCEINIQMYYLITIYHTTNKLVVLANYLYSKITYYQDRYEQVSKGQDASRSDAMKRTAMHKAR